MTIIKCTRCGSMWNNNTVPKCPACNVRKQKKIDKRENQRISSYRKTQEFSKR